MVLTLIRDINLNMDNEIVYIDYKDETMLPDIQRLVSSDLSEPYSIFTYRYFLHGFPSLCICAYKRNPLDPLELAMIGTIICKLEIDSQSGRKQGYMAMLAVDKSCRNKGIGKTLITNVIDRMIDQGCQEVLLETEASNTGALNLYLKLGFLKIEKMGKYYLNSGDAYKLILYIDSNKIKNNDYI